MTTLRIRISIAIAVCALCVTPFSVFAATGNIDPNNAGYHFAAFVHAPTNQAGSAEINFGKFSNVSAYNITISDDSLHGFAWSPIAGWIVMNCADTTSGCSSSNQNFKVAVSTTGVLSGYAWGQQTGWINFGPFLNNTASQIEISSNGNFGGTSGSAGYAWSESYGWIIFDCSNAATCVTTDYNNSTGTTTVQPSGGTISGGSAIGLPAVQPPVIPAVLPPVPVIVSPMPHASISHHHINQLENNPTEMLVQPVTLPPVMSQTQAPVRNTILPLPARSHVVSTPVSLSKPRISFLTSMTTIFQKILIFLKSIPFFIGHILNYL